MIFKQFHYLWRSNYTNQFPLTYSHFMTQSKEQYLMSQMKSWVDEKKLWGLAFALALTLGLGLRIGIETHN